MDGERLAELREEKGLTQGELGDLFSISQDTISNYERGKTSPDDETKVKFAKYFNVSLDYLLGLTREQIPIRSTGSRLLYFDNLPQGAADELNSFLAYLRKRYYLDEKEQ